MNSAPALDLGRSPTTPTPSDTSIEDDRSIVLAETLILPPEAVTETFAILATRGSGKSATAHRLVEQLYHAGLPTVVIDVKGDWWGIRSSADGAGPGLPFVIFGGDHADVPLEPTAGELLADLIVDDRLPAVLDLSHMRKAKARAFATAFVERLYARNRDPLHVVIDEADVLIPQRATADTARLLGAMEDLAKRGRSRGLGMTVATQRGQEVAKSVLELMETVILLRTTGPRSIKAAQDWISVNADSTGTRAREVVESLPTLRVGEAWVWSPAFLGLLQRVQLPLFETFDSHATPRPGQARVIPKTRAEIDLKKLTAEIAATAAKAAEHGEGRVSRSKSGGGPAPADDLVLVRARVGELEQTVRERDAEIETLRSRLAELDAVVSGQGLDESLRAAAGRIADVLQVIERARPVVGQATGPAPDRPSQIRAGGQRKVAAADPGETPAGRAGGARTLAGDEPLRFRAGALRMVEALGRMAPRRLTKAQWAVVAKMRHTSGTWSTYFGELRRAGLIDETSEGFTLTESGFEFLGGRPEPMSGDELRQHYLGILRAGAGRMLQAVIDAYPAGLSREEISARAGIVSSSGTFSTYWGELVRNGLVVQNGSSLTASDILMHGSGAVR
ncbi:hypothetical protein CKJ66_27325 [Mycobacterium avium]|uniref:Helicase HerA central domain-containing protein n=1 Tax=Mycobacterium avium TaxID=1764 RepID=A0A2A2ZB15_MYCAV|nr:type IV secretory system conjugative DNA transfer family protein [Mycobacterium avium]PBA23654.1 hypothetical protein CKJ66_27325 [Mycobacterium avium]